MPTSTRAAAPLSKGDRSTAPPSPTPGGPYAKLSSGTIICELGNIKMTKNQAWEPGFRFTGGASVHDGFTRRNERMVMTPTPFARFALPALLCAALAAGGLAPAARAETISEQDAHSIGVAAYLYFYSLVTMDLTRKQLTNVAKAEGISAPMNNFANIPAFPTADMKVVVRPNFDTLYSSAWLDLTKEPMIVSVPDTQGRYYLLPMLDMWTDVFASPGKRTTGTGAGSFVIVPPGWQGQIPQGAQRIDAPTSYVWIIGRTQTNGPKDYAAVNQVQDGYTVAR